MARASSRSGENEPMHSPLQNRTGYLLHKAGLLLVKEVEKSLVGLNIRGRHFHLLTALEGGTRYTQQNLSELLNLDPTVIVALVDDLEDLGYTERQRDKADRRRNVLILTDKGREVLIEAKAIVDKTEKDFLGDLSAAETKDLNRMLIRVMGNHWHLASSLDKKSDFE